MAWRRGDAGRARAIHEERLRYARDAGDPWLIASISVSLGQIVSEQGDHNRAKELLDASRASFSTVGDRIGMAWAISNLGRAARARGDRAEANEQFRESLRMYRELGALWGIAECLDDLAALAGEIGQSERATRLFGSAAELRQTVGVRLAARNVAKREREIDALRAALGPNRFEAAWRMGRELPLSEAIDAALTTDSRQPSASIAAPSQHESARPRHVKYSTLERFAWRLGYRPRRGRRGDTVRVAPTPPGDVAEHPTQVNANHPMLCATTRLTHATIRSTSA